MDTNSKLSNNTAVILVSHGSTLPFAEEVFTEIKEKFIKKTGLPAEIGYMKVSEPTIAGAVEILKDEVDDLNRIIALPVFLAPGIHTNIDIPTLCYLSLHIVDDSKVHASCRVCVVEVKGRRKAAESAKQRDSGTVKTDGRNSRKMSGERARKDAPARTAFRNASKSG